MSAALTPLARRTAATLAFAQCLYTCAIAIGVTLTGIVGSQLAPRVDLATLPFALLILTSALTTVPLSLLMGRFGRRPIFMIGACGALIGGGLAAFAIFQRDFALFCAGNACLGLFQASSQYYRYAATDTVPDPADKARAVSWVMIGGLVAAFLGPQIAAYSRNFWDLVPFAGSFAAISVLGAIAILALATLPHQPIARANQETGQPLGNLIVQPGFLLGLLCTALAYGTMTFVMTATPLAVVACGFTVDASAGVIQGHLLGMFAPAFFTGKLIGRYGVVPIVAVGVLLFVLSATTGLAGISIAHFTGALILNGVAWNMLFVGGSTLIAQAATAPKDRARLQAVSEFSVFGLSALASLTAGPAQAGWGWETVLGISLAPVALVGLSVAAYRVMGTRRAEA